MKTRPVKKPSPVIKNDQGVALLLVLWIITLLAIVCAEFSWTMRTETATVTNFKEGEQAYYTAEAGINKAIIELMRTAKNIRRSKKADDEQEESETDYWEPGSGPYVFEFEGAKCEITIEDEGNKIGINAFLKKAKRNAQWLIKLKNLLTEKIGLEGEQRDIVADSMLDWYDKDHNITGLNGAEDDYYESLDTPYECRDGEIPVLEELLLVRGIDEEIYYGQAGKPEHKTMLSSEELEQMLSGNTLNEELREEEEEEEDDDDATTTNLGLVNIFSVFSKSSTFTLNINTASIAQLLLLEGMDISTAREIINARKEKKFESKTDRLPQFSNYEVWKNSIKASTSKTSGYYKVKAKGFSSDGSISRIISCDMRISGSRCWITSWKAVD